MRKNQLVKHLASMLCLSVLVSGCASMTDSTPKSKSKKKEWSWFKKKEYQEPKSMVAIWSEDTLAQPGKSVTRGFGGRIYFYNERSQAIPVDGELMVYGFEDTSDSNHPTAWPSDEELGSGAKKFKFTAEQFTQHFSESELGASYSVWIPWDAVGGEQKKITLCPMFVGKSGRMTRGESAKLNLSGKKSANLADKSKNNPMQTLFDLNTVQLASASIPAVQPGSSLSRFSASPLQSLTSAPINSPMQTTTIKLGQPIGGGSQNTAAVSSGLAQNPNVAQIIQALQAGQAVSPAQPFAMQDPSVASLPIAPVGTAAALNAPTTNNWASTLPRLGHGIPATGWVQPGQVPLSQPAPLIGSQPHQFPAPGSTTVR
jgi:hypothetical protein